MKKNNHPGQKRKTLILRNGSTLPLILCVLLVGTGFAQSAATLKILTTKVSNTVSEIPPTLNKFIEIVSLPSKPEVIDELKTQHVNLTYETKLPFELYNAEKEVRPETLEYIHKHLIPDEALYFDGEFGLNEKSGIPYDHVRYRKRSKILGEVGHYTAASKLSLYVPFLMKIIQEKDGYKNLEGWSVQKAEVMLLKCLNTLRTFTKEYPNYKGFFPWTNMRPDGKLAPSNLEIPSLDNGQLTWALAAVTMGLKDHRSSTAEKIKRLANELLENQNYGSFYNSKVDLLHGTYQIDDETREWIPNPDYHLVDMYEGSMAILWAILHEQAPESVWDHVLAPTVDYQTKDGEIITTLKGFRASFHEWWALAYLPMMDSKLGALFYNYFHAQADFAIKHKLPGFPTTSYDPQGAYRQMGVPPLAQQKVDRTDVAVVYGTSIAAMIAPRTGLEWIKNLHEMEDLASPYGTVESIGFDGASDVFSADSKGMTLLATSGGIVEEITAYLKSKKYQHSEMTLYDKLIELLNKKYRQIVFEREEQDIFHPARPIAEPQKVEFEEFFELPPKPGPEFVLSSNWQKGHLHGKNITSIDKKALEDDIRKDQDFTFQYNIPAKLPAFDQWAFRGTYVDGSVGISDMKYLEVTIPTKSQVSVFELELKSDDITLASAVVSTLDEGRISEDKQWKTLLYPIFPVPEAEYKPLNYFATALHDPSYLDSKKHRFVRRGKVRLKDVRLLDKHPFKPQAETPEHEKDMKQRTISQHIHRLSQYWRPSHGNMQFKRIMKRRTLIFNGKAGWRGGYMPYTDLSGYKYIYIQIRNLSQKKNSVRMEMKKEGNRLYEKKLKLEMEEHLRWQFYEVKLPEDNKKTLNYFALSDSVGDFELGSIILSAKPIRGIEKEQLEIRATVTHEKKSN